MDECVDVAHHVDDDVVENGSHLSLHRRIDVVLGICAIDQNIAWKRHVHHLDQWSQFGLPVQIIPSVLDSISRPDPYRIADVPQDEGREFAIVSYDLPVRRRDSAKPPAMSLAKFHDELPRRCLRGLRAAPAPFTAP